MRLLAGLIFAGLACQAQTITATVGSAVSYNAQYGSTGRFSDHDSTQAAWCADGNTYVTGDDGNGPQAVLSGGRNTFLTRLSADYSTQTLVNSMDSLGTITQEVYGNGRSIKSTGIECDHGVMYLFIYAMDDSNFNGGNVSLLISRDLGATWCNQAHTNHTTGVCTITPVSNGDLPLVSEFLFPASAGLSGLLPMKYCQDDSINCPTVDGNDVYKYFLGQALDQASMYGLRVLRADYPKADGSLYQWYKGGSNFRDPANWSSNAVDKVDIGMVPGNSSLPGQPLYIPQARLYVTIMTSVIGATQSNRLYSSPTPFGPWTLVTTLSLNVAPVDNLAFYTAVHKSFRLLSATSAAVEYLSTGSYLLRSGDPATNGYAPWFQTVTFTWPAPPVSTAAVAVSGRTTFSGKVTIP